MTPENFWFYMSHESCLPGNAKPETPIERALYRGIQYVMASLYMWDEKPAIEAQVKIDKYRVDFLIGRGTKCQVVVECDGHDFHERTKEQAAKDRSRDRRLTILGYTVIRFTGSEIYEDPFWCASEALSVWYQGMLEVRTAA